jgi:hypothetical protein
MAVSIAPQVEPPAPMTIACGHVGLPQSRQAAAKTISAP